MSTGHLQNQRIKLLRQIAKDTARLAKLDAARKSLMDDIARAQRLKSQVDKKLGVL